MQDTIIKGTGNSRTLGSVPNFMTLYPTYEAFAQALINKTLPIDLGPMNPVGVQQAGTDLSKTNLLKDATAALYGLPSTAVPDDALAKARQLIMAAQNEAAGRGQIILGSYTGTGTSGQSSPNKIVVAFPPKAMILSTDNGGQAIAIFLRDMSSVVGVNLVRPGTSRYPLSWESMSVVWADRSVSWYYVGNNPVPGYQFNEPQSKYVYLILG